MAIQPNVTLLIPSRKIYCDYRLNLSPYGAGIDNHQGVWEEISWKVTPARAGFIRTNPFPETKGDVYLQRKTYAFMMPNKAGSGGARIFMFNFGHLARAFGVPPGTAEPVIGYAEIAVDVRQHAFPAMGKEEWAKEAMLIPQMENITRIF